MTFHDFVRFHVWPWSALNNLRWQRDLEADRVATLESAIKEWHKTGETTHLVAIAKGGMTEVGYELRQVAGMHNPLWDMIKDIKPPEDE